MPLIDITGQNFGRLRVESYAGLRRGKPHWNCVCRCGNRLIVRGDMLKCLNTKSCGCQKIDAATKHGHSHSRPDKRASRTYNSWQAMLDRCTKKNDHAYRRYGAIGVSICDRWLSFDNFLADMGERPDGCTLDRFPDRNGNYEPSNCRWATAKQQARNRRNTPMLTYKGETKSISEWAELHGLSNQVVYCRLFSGWSPYRALNTPVIRRA